MYELDKIQEAEYFYDQMKVNEEKADVFKYNLSAFLSSARSALQFALKEAETKSGGIQWYDSVMMGNAVLSFFKDKRDINIHAEPVKVRKDISILIRETIRISESIRIVKRDAQGNITGEYNSKSESSKPKEEIPPEVTYRYRFDDWSGAEDIPTLCQKYLVEIKQIITYGKSKGFLS